MISNRHKRTAYRAWMVLVALFACAQFLTSVQSVKDSRGAQETSKAVQVKLDPEEGCIYLAISRCISYKPTASVSEEAAKCITELHSHFSSLSEEQKNAAYCVRIKRQTLKCFCRCCEELMVHLVHQLGGIEGLCVSELRVGSQHIDSTQMSEMFFIDNPKRPVVVATLFVYNVSSVCFHSICSTVQMRFSDKYTQSMMYTLNVPHIDFTKHPLKCPWSVSSIKVEGAETVDLGESMEYLANAEEDSRAKGSKFWVKKRIVIDKLASLCVPDSIVSLIEQGVVLEIKTDVLGIAVAESTPVTELPRVVYRAVCAIRKISTGQNKQRYVVVSHEAYRQGDPEALRALAQQISDIIESGLEQQNSLESSQAVELRAARNASPFMRIHVGNSYALGSIPCVVRVEKEVLESADRCAEAADTLNLHAENMHVLEGAAVLRTIEGSNFCSYISEDITERRGMTLLPCGCFKEDALNKMWHGSTQACTFRERAQYQDFPQITLFCRADGSVDMKMPRVVPLFAMPKAQNPVYQVSDTGDQSIEIRVFKVQEEGCPGLARVQSITQIQPEVIDVISRMKKGANPHIRFKKITLVSVDPMGQDSWMYVCMHVLKVFTKKQISADTVEIGGSKEETGKRSRTYQKAVLRNLLSKKAWEWSAHIASSLQISMLGVNQQLVGHLPSLSQIVRTANLLVTVGGKEELRVYVPKEDAVSANPLLHEPRSTTSSCISKVIVHLAKCNWKINELYVRGKYRVCRGMPEARPDLKVVQESEVCKRVVLEGDVVFESLEAIPAYFEWKKAGKMHSSLEVSIKDPEKVWIDDKAFCSIEDCRPQIQRYLEALMEWHPTGVHVVFQVCVSAESEYDITGAYDFYPQRYLAQWQQLRPGSWKIELEMRECSEKADSAEPMLYHQIYLAQAMPKQPEYEWVHVPGWAMCSVELKEETLEILEELFGNLGFKNAYMGVVQGGIQCPGCHKEHEFACNSEISDSGITVLRCGHVYHKQCINKLFKMKKEVLCQACKSPRPLKHKSVPGGRIATRSAKKEQRSKDALEMVPDYSHVVDGGDITWIIMEETRVGVFRRVFGRLFG